MELVGSSHVVLYGMSGSSVVVLYGMSW